MQLNPVPALLDCLITLVWRQKPLDAPEENLRPEPGPVCFPTVEQDAGLCTSAVCHRPVKRREVALDCRPMPRGLLFTLLTLTPEMHL